MNKLPLEKRVQILTMLVEGSSLRSVSRVCDVSINTVTKLLVDAGKVCAAFHAANVKNVKAKRIQCDEIWSFCYAKNKNVPNAKRKDVAYGDVWTWTGLDADSKLIVSWMVGGRDSDYAMGLMDDLRSRLANRVQLTTDGHKPYLTAVEEPGRREALQSSGLHRLQERRDHWRSRSSAHQHQLCRASEPHDAHVHAKVHPSNERLLQED